MATGGLYGNSTNGALVATSGAESSGLYGNSPVGALIAQPGAESSGLYGNASNFGGTYFEWFIFYDSLTQPATPTGGSWDFTTNIGTAPSGWLNSPPPTPTNLIWVSIAVVNSRNTGPLTWSTPGLMTGSGLPILTGSGVPSSGAGLNNQLYIDTSTTPQSLYHKQSGSWVQLTGSSIYALAGANANITSMTGITGGISTPDFIQFDTVAAAGINLGKLRWNDTTNTLAFGVIDGTDEINIGEQMVAYVTNADSVTITRGQPVYLYAATGNRASVKLAANTGDSTSAKTLGLAMQNIAPNGAGFVMTQGVLDKIDTSAFAEGVTLYLGATAGTLTSTKPKAPNHLVYIGVVERSNAGNGQIYVKPQNGYELDEIHDVQINSPVNGQTIVYDQSTSLWKNANITAGTGISITNGPGSIIISAPDTGTVTSVNASGGTTGMVFTGGPVTSSGTLTLGGTLGIGSGGTGAVTASDARTNLGLGTISTQNANSVSITGGSISGITDLAIADGGTGASTAADARSNLGLGTSAVLNAGVANGSATLDAGGTIPLSQIPASLQGGVSYQGTWNASTNTPTLTSSVGAKGYYYVVSVAGSTNLNGITDWLPGDWAIFNGSAWEKIDNTDAVSSVNGYTGAVVLSASDVGAPPTSRTITAGTGLTGGGDLSANRTLSIDVTGVTAASYGSASKTLTATVNAQGQLTALADTDIAITNTQVSGLGTMSTQDANNVAVTGGSINNTVIGNVTPNAGTFTTLTANTSGTFGTSSSAVTPLAVNSGAGANNTRGITFNISGGTFPYGRIAVPAGSGGALGFFASDSSYEPVEQFRVTRTASAVNYVQVTGSATGARPTISAQGSDAAITMGYAAKGSGGGHIFTTNGNRAFQIDDATSAVNNLLARGSAAGSPSVLSVQGTDTNIGISFISKGTGAINLAPGSSGVNISNGGTVTAITRTAGGSGYTTAITATVSAPTTAGGVQATANAYVGAITTVVTSGGTGYTVGDVITVSGGTGIQAQSYTVSAVSGGVITAVTIQNFGQYTALPSSPVSVTGGTGTGATLTLSNWSMTAIAVATAGSGYVEQPTVTFSGGGGSGAAAYATVGSGTIVRSLGSTLSFHSPNGETFRIADNGTTGGAYWAALSGATQSELRGSNASAGAAITNAGAFPILFRTSISTEQFRVAHTASAVNYVQVTGAATTSIPVISAQGSDSNVSLYLSGKGTGTIRLATNGTANTQFRVTHTSSSVNFLNATGSVANSAPVLSVDGNDTNIDLALTPKGAGVVVATGGTLQAGTTGSNGNLNLGGVNVGFRSAYSANVFGMYTNNAEQMRIGNTASAVNYVQVTGGVTGGGVTTSPTISAQGSDTNVAINVNGKGSGSVRFAAQRTNYITASGSASTGGIVTFAAEGGDTNIDLALTTKGTGAVRFNTGGGEQVRVSNTASAVNYVQVTGAATGNDPVISAQGSDADRNLRLTAKGTGQVATTSSFLAHISATNYIQLSGGASAVSLSAVGASANVDVTLTPKGTGRVQFGTYTATVSSITGYIEIKDSGGTVRRLAVVA